MEGQFHRITSWEAYTILFKEVRQKRKWSLPQLIDALRDDAERRNLPNCTYFRRSIEAYQSNPKKTSARQPRQARVKHLHQFLTDQLIQLGRIDKYRQHLWAIAAKEDPAPPQAELPHAPKDILEFPGFELPSSNITLPQNRNQDLIQIKADISKKHSASNRKSSKKQRTKLRSFDLPKSDWKAAMKSLDKCHYTLAGHLFHMHTVENLSAAKELIEQGRSLAHDGYVGILASGIAYIREQAMGEAFNAINFCIEEVSTSGDLVQQANMEICLGALNSIAGKMADDKNRVRYESSAIKAFRKGASFFRRDTFPFDWFFANFHLARALLNQPKRGKGGVFSKLRAEGRKIFSDIRGTLKFTAEYKAFPEAAGTLGDYFYDLYLITSRVTGNKLIYYLLRESIVAYLECARLTANGMNPVIWLQTQLSLGACYYHLAVHVSLYNTENYNRTHCIVFLREARRILKRGLNRAKRKHDAFIRTRFKRQLDSVQRFLGARRILKNSSPPSGYVQRRVLNALVFP